MWFLPFAGAVSLISGILFLFLPKYLHKLSDRANRMINRTVLLVDKEAYKLRIGLGISMVLVSLFCFFVFYYLIRKHA